MNVIESMMAKGLARCSDCGCICEHGWDAHTMITPDGLKVVCSVCHTTLLKKDVDTSRKEVRLCTNRSADCPTH